MKYLLCLFLFFPALYYGQLQKKNLASTRMEASPSIDGKLDDAVWQSQSLPVADNFVMFEPDNGPAIPARFTTRVKLFYTDEAIYIGAMMYDNAPDSILTQLTPRDQYNQNTDWVGFFINPYNDGLSDFNFWVTAAGVQADARTTAEGDDFSWNTVWKSAVQINDSGWTCEIRIPYLALRFPETPVKDWGLNMFRSIRRNRRIYSWNFINKELGYRYEYQCGLFTGVENIQPPVRLSLMPYLSTYVDDFDGSTTYDFNGGLDLKYGINESFTLDMTLIPDFGQVAVDRQFVNLTPFENRFDENRQFFTEGTELFTLGGLFYSRRIGGEPKNITGQDLNDTTAISVQTEYTRLLNATKISGRTEGNLGIGFLNAITDNSYATFTEVDGTERKELQEPLTNYNVLVLDQRFNRNSSLSFINTNVWRAGPSPDANVAGLLTSLTLPRAIYRIDASLKRSDIFEEKKSETGYETQFRFGDVSGNWQWAVKEDVKTKTYQINDLGFLQRNNQWKHYGEVVYQTFKPKSPGSLLNRYSYQLFAAHTSLYEPRFYESFYLGASSFWLGRNFFGSGVNLNYNPVESYNYYEPRSPGRFFRVPEKFSIHGFISSDYRKTLALDANFTYGHWNAFGRDQYTLNLEPRLRLGDHFFGIVTIGVDKVENDIGFARKGSGEDEIYFGRRDVFNITNALDARYVFNPRTTLSLTLRHLWTGLTYENTLLLQEDGSLEDGNFAPASDINFNTVNLDLRFSWWFAPGSELVLLYRNVVASQGNAFQYRYLDNVNTVLASPMQNNLSLKLTYFLDYNKVRELF